MRVFILLICLLLPLACVRESVTEVVSSFGTGTWSGTFEPYFLRHEPQPTGTITITFRDSTYRYTGDYVIMHANPVKLQLNWQGAFKLANRDTIYFRDAWTSRVSIDPRVLGLDGAYHYTFRGKTVTASNGDTLYPITLVLQKAD
jgi:hypothetical protein